MKLLRMRRLLLLFVLLALSLIGCRWAISPHWKPNPTKKVVVRGVFPYDRGWDLRVHTSFYTNNPTCKVTARAFFIFPIADVSRETRLEIPVTREDGGRYSFTYYEDYFQPGFCDWEQGFVTVQQFQDGHWQPGSSAILGLNHQFNLINYECHYINLLAPGLGKDAREKSVVCGENKERPSQRSPLVADNEVNFTWKAKTLYERLSSSGQREMVWAASDGRIPNAGSAQ